MEEYVVYVLYSSSGQRRYVGYTSDLINRFKSHNYLGKKGWTIRYRPWQVIHVEFYESQSAAIQREKALKSGQGRKWMDENLTKAD